MANYEKEENPVRIERADHTLADAIDLIARMDAELIERYGDSQRGRYQPLDFSEAGSAFFLARSGGQAIGCGGLRPLEPGIGEVRRVYVAPEMRGAGVARAILRAIEEEGRRVGYRALRLGTRVLQPEAVRLYERAAYRRIARYGRYVGDTASLCFEKDLSRAGPELRL